MMPNLENATASVTLKVISVTLVQMDIKVSLNVMVRQICHLSINSITRSSLKSANVILRDPLHSFVTRKLANVSVSPI